jgi:pimeloyl-ACP methyl ester carboxylesterase
METEANTGSIPTTELPSKQSASWRKRLLKAFAWLAPGFLGLVYLGISLYSAEVLTRTHNHPAFLDPRAVSPLATPWAVKTADGLTLRGWYHPTEDRRRLVVLVHGLWSCWDEMAGLGRDLHRRGYDVLLFDLRGHGQSDPSRVTMGRRERGDIRAVLSWAGEQGFEADRIGWVGYSMGASTLLMEAAYNPNIRVAVLDSPYGNLPDLLDKQLSQHSHLPRFFNPGILTAAHLAFGVRTDDLVPIRSARNWGERPLLVIHGEADTIVPVVQARLLAREAGASCQAVTLPGIDHVQAYRADPVAYVAAVDTFFRRNLSP